MSTWGTVAEASVYFGVTRQRINRLISKGAFPGSRLVATPRGGVWMIPRPFVRTELRVGRPPKKRRNRKNQ